MSYVRLRLSQKDHKIAKHLLDFQHRPNIKDSIKKDFKEWLEEYHNNLEVDKAGDVWYKCREIVGVDVNGMPVLNRKYEWLKEALEDALER